jgi:hypothetical protein
MRDDADSVGFRPHRLIQRCFIKSGTNAGFSGFPLQQE